MAERRVSFLIGANIQNFTKGLNKAQKQFRKFGRDMERIGSTMSRSITLPLVAMGGYAVKAAADLDALRQGFTAITGSVEETNEQLKRLRQIGKLPAVDFMQAAQTSMAFQAIGKSAEFAERTITNVANAVALSGGGAQEFGGVMRQLRQVASLGRLMGEEMNTILENAPAMAKAIKIAFGTTSTEAIREMDLTAEELFERLNKGLEELPQVTGGAKNALDNFGQAVKDAAQVIGDVLLPVVIPLVKRVSSLFESLRTVNPEIVKMGVVIAGIVAAVGPTILVVGKLVTAISMLMNPIGLVVVAVAGLAVAVYKYWDEITKFFSKEGPEFMQPVLRAIEAGVVFIENRLKLLKIVFVKALDSISALWDVFGGAIVLAFEQIFNSLATILTVGFEALSIILNILSGRWLTDWDGFLEDVKTSWVNIFVAIEDHFKGFLGRSASAIAGIGSKVGSAIGDGVLSIVASLGLIPKEMEGTVGDAVNKFNERNNKVFKEASGNAEEFADWITELGKRLKDLKVPTINLFGSSETPSDSPERPKNPIGFSKLPKPEVPKTDWSQYRVDTSKAGAAIAKLKEGFSSTKKVALDFSSALQSQITSSVNSFAETLGNVFTGDMGASDFFSNILLAVADFAIQLGKAVTAMGVSALALETLFVNPFAAIAAGAALITAGTIAKNLISDGPKIPKMATGGIVPAGFPNDTYPAFLSSGETVIPSPKALPSGMNQNINLSGEFRVKGSDLVLTLERANAGYSR